MNVKRFSCLKKTGLTKYRSDQIKNSSLGDFFRSGKRRKYTAERLGYKKIPVIIRMMQDDEAVVTMVDSNLQREQITPSEKAYAYNMKYDAIKKKAGRKNRYVLYCVKRYVQM